MDGAARGYQEISSPVMSLFGVCIPSGEKRQQKMKNNVLPFCYHLLYNSLCYWRSCSSNTTSCLEVAWDVNIKKINCQNSFLTFIYIDCLCLLKCLSHRCFQADSTKDIIAFEDEVKEKMDNKIPARVKTEPPEECVNYPSEDNSKSNTITKFLYI